MLQNIQQKNGSSKKLGTSVPKKKIKRYKNYET